LIRAGSLPLYAGHVAVLNAELWLCRLLSHLPRLSALRMPILSDPRKRVAAVFVAIACVLLSFFFVWWSWSISAFLGAWYGVSRFKQAYDRLEILRVFVAAGWLLCQVAGGIARGVALDMEEAPSAVAQGGLRYSLWCSSP